MGAYYNEHDPEAAAWLRVLIRLGLIAPGDVDERDIRDVIPIELSGYRQCHFFAGVGAWSYALRQAGWPDDRPVWTGSCPCQSFSAAGERKGFADERHLWPSWLHLISQCRPATLFGEQVASSDSKPWLDLVQDDLEALGYAVGPIVLPAAGFGAPHPRHRIYFVADADSVRRDGGTESTQSEARLRSRSLVRGAPSDLADADGDSRRQGDSLDGGRGQRGSEVEGAGTGDRGVAGIVGHASEAGLSNGEQRATPQASRKAGRPTEQSSRAFSLEPHRPGPVNGFWGNADWLRCTDEFWRSARPGSFPLVDGTSSRVVRSGDPGEAVDAGTAEARAMRLRGYGNAICVEAAKAFIEAYLLTDISPSHRKGF